MVLAQEYIIDKEILSPYDNKILSQDDYARMRWEDVNCGSELYERIAQNILDRELGNNRLAIHKVFSSLVTLMSDNTVITNENGKTRIDKMKYLLVEVQKLCDDTTLKSIDKKELTEKAEIIKNFITYVNLCMDFRDKPTLDSYDNYFGLDVKNKISPKEFYVFLHVVNTNNHESNKESINIESCALDEDVDPNNLDEVSKVGIDINLSSQEEIDEKGINMSPSSLHELTEQLRKKYAIKKEKKEEVHDVTTSDDIDMIVRAIDILRDPKIKFIYDAFIQSKSDEELQAKVKLDDDLIIDLVTLCNKSLDLQSRIVNLC